MTRLGSFGARGSTSFSRVPVMRVAGITSSMAAVTTTIARPPIRPKSAKPRKSEMARISRPRAVVSPDVATERPVEVKVSTRASSGSRRHSSWR